jgi:uncharacterized protein with NRDE domain
MCLILFAKDYHPDYKIILAANRDEFYHRKTAAANFWDEHPDVLAGKDLEAGGTWLGITKKGKIGMLTNYRDLRHLKDHAPTRGRLVLDYLINGHKPDEYLDEIKPTASNFNGFNLIVGQPEQLLYFSNFGNGIEEIPNGIFGISNHLLETPWPKVQRGKSKLQSLIDAEKFEVENFFDLLKDDAKAADDQLPDTGLDLERERALSSMFIKSPGYGSRCSTLIMVNKKDEVLFAERVYNPENGESNTRSHQFLIKK